MKWQYAFVVVVVGAVSSAGATTPKRIPTPAAPPADDRAVQPSGYVHIVQSTDRLATIAKYYKVSEDALRAVNADLFAYNERETGHRLIIDEPILLPMGCVIPKNAMYARRADALDKPSDATVVTTHESPAELDQLRSGSGWQTQYSRKTGKTLPIFKPAAPYSSSLAAAGVSSQSTKTSDQPLAYGITTSDLPSQKQGVLGNAANRHVRLSSVFGLRGFRHHKGIDIPFDENTPIVAAGDGVVERCDHDLMGYGNFVIVSHGRYETRYAHLNRIDVRPGQQVQGGVTLIGLSGSTGHSTGPHLHFEVRVDGEAVDPVSHFLPGIQTMLRGMSSAAGTDQASAPQRAGPRIPRQHRRRRQSLAAQQHMVIQRLSAALSASAAIALNALKRAL